MCRGFVAVIKALGWPHHVREIFKLRRWEIAVLGMFLSVLAGVWLYVAGYVPGTLRKRPDGFYFGTGTTTHRYTNGAIALEDYYRAGKLKHSKWYKPDGSVVAETSWRNGTNVGYFLRENGTIRIKMPYIGKRAHGLAIYYKEDGVTVDHVEEFRDGVKVSSTAGQ